MIISLWMAKIGLRKDQRRMNVAMCELITFNYPPSPTPRPPKKQHQKNKKQKGAQKTKDISSNLQMVQ